MELIKNGEHELFSIHLIDEGNLQHTFFTHRFHEAVEMALYCHQREMDEENDTGYVTIERGLLSKGKPIVGSERLLQLNLDEPRDEVDEATKHLLHKRLVNLLKHSAKGD